MDALFRFKHLANLVDLEWLHFWDLPKGIGIPEVLFFKQHWRSLEGLICFSYTNSDEVKEWLAVEWPELKIQRGHGLWY